MVGMNMGGGCNGIDLATQRAQFEQTRKATGINTARTWWFQSWGGPSDWSRFDREVKLARDNGMKLVVTFANQWGECEPRDESGA